jgi:DNA repair photolyase
MRTYSAVPATRALTPTGGFLDGFSYSLNPYVGCAFGDNGGCPFCYVRALPVARAQAGPWGGWVVAKSNLLELLARELGALEKSGKLERAAVLMSSAADPYQGMERRMRLTRGALELFVRRPPRRVLLQTRSPMIERDLDLLTRLGPRLIASITVETDDEQVRRALTPTAPAARGRRVRAARDRSDDAEPSRVLR